MLFEISGRKHDLSLSRKETCRMLLIYTPEVTKNFFSQEKFGPNPLAVIRACQSKQWQQLTNTAASGVSVNQRRTFLGEREKEFFLQFFTSSQKKNPIFLSNLNTPD